MNQQLGRLLHQYGVKLTLLDLGASGGTYPPFRKALDAAILIEVDPDRRNFGAPDNNHDRLVVGKAITDNDSDDFMKIYDKKN